MRPDSLPNLRKCLIKVFNAFIRERDRDLTCISCGTGPVQNAGHYWSTGACPQPSMRFNEKNVNGQCVDCNKWKGGAVQRYERNLIKKYGPGVIEELDVIRSLPQKPWHRFEYLCMIAHYKKKLKALLK